MKQALAIILIVVAVAAIAGCQKKPVKVASSEPLIKVEAEKGPALPLDEVIAGGEDALESTESTDLLEGDEFLNYVNRAKQRDRDDAATSSIATLLAEAMTNTLVTMVDELQSAMVQGLSDIGFTETVAVSQDSSGTSDSGGDMSTDSGSTGDTQDDSEQAQLSTYTSTAKGFSIDFPSGWAISEGEDGDIETVTAESPSGGAGDNFLENITVGISDLPDQLSADDYADQLMGEIEREVGALDETERMDVTIDGKTAKKVVYTYDMAGTSVKVLMYAIPNGYKGFSVKCAADSSKYDGLKDLFEGSAESLSL